METRTTLQLATRLNEITKEHNELELKLVKLEKEYNDIIHELWERIPNVRDDVNLQPMTRSRIKKEDDK